MQPISRPVCDTHGPFRLIIPMSSVCIVHTHLYLSLIICLHLLYRPIQTWGLHENSHDQKYVPFLNINIFMKQFSRTLLDIPQMELWNLFKYLYFLGGKFWFGLLHSFIYHCSLTGQNLSLVMRKKCLKMFSSHVFVIITQYTLN